MDEALIYSLQQGSEEVFRGIYDDYHPKLYGYFLKKTRSPGVSEDLVQETFIKLWRFREGLNPELSLSIQVFRIARTTIIDLLRKNARSRMESVPFTHMAQLADSLSQTDPSEALPRLSHIRDTLSRLSPMRRKIIEQRLEGFSNHEIAANLSISKKTVENQINKAFQEIKKYAEAFFLILLIGLFLH
jgi:RNA polymerase sigma factor (sigma-70 family)